MEGSSLCSQAHRLVTISTELSCTVMKRNEMCSGDGEVRTVSVSAGFASASQSIQAPTVKTGQVVTARNVCGSVSWASSDCKKRVRQCFLGK
jgi:hypothetical protein